MADRMEMIKFWLAIAAVGQAVTVYGIVLWGAMYGKYTDSTSLVFSIVTSSTGAMMLGLSYFFGSSAGSASKTGTIAEIAKKGPTQ